MSEAAEDEVTADGPDPRTWHRCAGIWGPVLDIECLNRVQAVMEGAPGDSAHCREAGRLLQAIRDASQLALATGLLREFGLLPPEEDAPS